MARTDEARRIISASRRTDLPAFHIAWLRERLAEGWVDVANPYDPARLRRVSLRPEEVHTIVLWSKDFGPFLREAEAFRPYRLYLLFTINDCPPLEPRVPPLPERIAQAREIALRHGPERIGWRFDPIVFWAGGTRDNLAGFERIADELAAVGVPRVIASFCHLYGKVVRRMRRQGLEPHDPPPARKREIGARLAAAARDRGMTLESCCDPELLAVPGVRARGCIHGPLLEQLAGEPVPRARDPGQRKACRCTVSADIGDYGMGCAHRCLYCYAAP